MQNSPNLAQLLKHSIENRLIDIHTAIIGRIEKYDATTQTADIQPVLKRAIKTADGDIKQEQLPLLVDVPILFPRAGGFFISFPIQPGDFVQVLFNEVSIDDFLTESATSMDYVSRFSLQGAVGLPGISPLSNAISDAHRSNFVLGRDGGAQIHIDGDKIRLGSEKADEALAIASKVKAELDAIKSAFASHTHTGSCSTGAVTTNATLSQIKRTRDIATKKVVAQ